MPNMMVTNKDCGILLILLAGLQNLCAEWVTYNDKEYYFGTLATETSNTWHTSRSLCQQNGGDLVSITSHEEYTWIVDQQKAAIYTGTLWIGLNFLDKTNWKWSDGEIMVLEYWADGQPVNNKDTHKEKRFCAYQAGGDNSYLWYNDHCSQQAGFICKRNPGSTDPITDPPTPSVGGFCPSGYFTSDESNNKCYKVVRVDDISFEGLNYTNAVAECRKGPGFHPDIVSIQSAAENALLVTQFQRNGQGMWIGYYTHATHAHDDASWRWADNSAKTYANWASDRPGVLLGRCAEIMIQNQYDLPGTWGNLECDQQRGYICQTYKSSDDYIGTPPPTTPNVCRSDYTPFWYGCYKLVQDSPKTWDEASQYCKNEGADLVSIHSSPENSALFVKLSSFNKDAWIGFRDFNVDGEYIWSDNWAVQYTNWASNEPSIIPGSGCVTMRADGKWYNNDCSVLKAFICKTTTVDPITPPAHFEGVCPGEDEGDTSWVHFGDSCYYFMLNYAKTWSEANEQCNLKSNVAFLASIHSSVENNFILKEMEKHESKWYAWIGMYRSKSGRDWHWIDGSSVQYTKWAPGQPDEEYDCAMMYKTIYSGDWSDADCYQPRGYICKAPKGAKITPPPTLNGTCPDGWVPYGSSCYFFQPNRVYHWQTAQEECVALGGPGANLASIHTKFESDFIDEEMKKVDKLPDPNNYWIGYVKKGPLEEGNEFYWIDGTPADYHDWYWGEPNDEEGVGNCVSVYRDLKTWDVISCNVGKAFVCKVDMVITENSATGLSSGAIAGVIFGILASLILIIAIIVFILDRLKVLDTMPGIKVLFKTSNTETDGEIFT